MTEFEYNGVVLEMDLLDADVIGKYERLSMEMAKKANDASAYEDKAPSEAMIYQCDLVDDFFDAMFGKGTAESLFGGGHNLGKRIDAYGALTDMVRSSSRSQVNEIMNKYSSGRIDRRQQNQPRQQYTNKPNYGKSKKKRYYA